MDPNVPLAASVGALAEMRAEGLIRFVGLSNVSTEQLREARSIVPVVAVQNRFNVASGDGADVLEACREAGIAFVTYSPLGADPFAREAPLAAGVGALSRVAERPGATPGQVVLAWLLHRAPNILPITGTTGRAHLEENVAAARLRLSEEDLLGLGGHGG